MARRWRVEIEWMDGEKRSWTDVRRVSADEAILRLEGPDRTCLFAIPLPNVRGYTAVIDG